MAASAAMPAMMSAIGPAATPLMTAPTPFITTPALETTEAMAPMAVIIFPTTISTGPMAAAIPAIVTINFCVSGDISRNFDIRSRIRAKNGVMIGIKTCPSSAPRFLISVPSARMVPLAPSASLAACPCAAPVCSMMRARVAACFAARVSCSFSPISPISIALVLIMASFTAMP